MTELRYAFYIVALSFIWLMLEYLAGLHDRYISLHPFVTLFALLIPAIFYFIALKRKRDLDYDGYFTFWQGTKSGMMLTLILAVLMIPMQWIFHNLINPTFFDRMIEHSVDRSIVRGKDGTLAQREAMEYFNLMSYIVQSVIGIIVIGTVLTVVYTMILSRNRNNNLNRPPFDDQDPSLTMPHTPAP